MCIFMDICNSHDPKRFPREADTFRVQLEPDMLSFHSELPNTQKLTPRDHMANRYYLVRLPALSYSRVLKYQPEDTHITVTSS